MGGDVERDRVHRHLGRWRGNLAALTWPVRRFKMHDACNARGRNRDWKTAVVAVLASALTVSPLTTGTALAQEVNQVRRCGRRAGGRLPTPG